ncbi:MAG: D-alanyl-D-alanine carboxypeptidase [Candidatus Curtissbacteria bacterium]|nr:D-alanyl-D-alanine carboxypeptidase [Candidatus Curtissbacteria bacterium]
MVRFFAVIFLVFSCFGLFLFKRDSFGTTSPIPAEVKNKPTKSVNSWYPNVLGQRSENLILSSSSAILVDYDSAEVVYGKNVNDRLPAASTIKIMTALVALENANAKDVFAVSEKAASVGENSMGLSAGEKATLEELLYGMMLVSGNDAAVVVAEGVSGGEEEFVSLMNNKAAELGLKDTKFVNASGLDVDGEVQYSSAYDMAVIARYVWENYPTFRNITSTFHKYIETTSTHKDFDLYNDTNLLTTYPGVRGIKPGFTWEAGLCLVTYAENDDRKLIGVVLGSGDRRGEMKELLDYGFGSFGIVVIHPDLDL